MDVNDQLVQAIEGAIRDTFTIAMSSILSEGVEGAFMAKNHDGLVSSIGFTGGIEGSIGMFFSNVGACKIVSKMLGLELNELDNDVCDGVGEIVNMVVGGIKIKMADAKCSFEIGTPITFKGKGLAVINETNSIMTRIIKSFKCDDVECTVVFVYKVSKPFEIDTKTRKAEIIDAFASLSKGDTTKKRSAVDLLNQAITKQAELHKETRKILIVDDKKSNRKLLNIVLTKDNSNYTISEASSGEDALTAVKEDMPDIILLDIMMPGMDGFEVCAKLKSNKKYCEIPILFITAMNENDDMVKGFKLGAADYITKPIKPAEVKVRVAAHLRMKKDVAEGAIKKIIVTCNHEMRQPLTAVMAYVDILLDEIDENEENHKMLKIVKEQNLRVVKILDRLITLEEFTVTNYIQGISMIDLKL